VAAGPMHNRIPDPGPLALVSVVLSGDIYRRTVPKWQECILMNMEIHVYTVVLVVVVIVVVVVLVAVVTTTYMF